MTLHLPRPRIFLFLLLAAAVAAPMTLALGEAGMACPEDAVRGMADARSPLARGEDPMAALPGRLVTIGGRGRRAAYLHTGSPKAVLRHVAAGEGSGVAYVEDRAGPDVITIVTAAGLKRLAPGGEVTHPAWSSRGELAYAVDLARIEVLDPAGEARALAPPPGAVGVFSPVFLAPGVLLSVVQEDVPGVGSHDDTLDNVWRADVSSGTWQRVTAFTGDADRWSIVRTPVVDDTGIVRFVRERGHAQTSKPSAFELWRTDGFAAEKVRDLPGEMFLAAVDGDRLLWNVDSGGEWRLFLETPEGMRGLGCGSVMVDPRAAADPDHRGEELDGSSSGTAAALSTWTPEPMGVVVGDFTSREQAEIVAASVPESWVIDSAAAPSAVAPGVYAVAVAVPPDADLERALDDFRSAHPELAERSWIASLMSGGEER